MHGLQKSVMEMNFEFPSMAQDINEFETFLDKIEPLTLESILEIGVWHGGTLARIGNRFPYCTIVGIDPAPQVEKWRPEWGPVTFVYGKSQDISVRGQAITANMGRKFDVVWIDGDHEFDACVADWHWAQEIATKAIGFHDIVDSHNDMIQVHYLWNEIHKQSHYRTEEIKKADGNYGIGLVYL